jgi:hypothetical protein
MAAGDPGILKRNYSAIAVETTLSAGISSQASGDTNTSFVVASVSGFPSTFPYTLLVDPDTNKEEVLTVYAGAGTSLSVYRGQDGSAAPAHSAGATVRHGISAREFKELQTHISARGFVSDSGILNNVDIHVHGIITGEGDVVGTAKTQALTNKDLTSGTNTFPTTLATLTGSQTLSNKILTSPTINTATIAGGTITGLSAPSSGGDAANKTYVDGKFDSAVSAETSATAAAASAAAASTSETNAAASEASATSSASSATASASTATTQGSNASTSATAAAGSASTATTQATNASNSATAAATSETNAANSATAAANSATSASGSATSASNSYTAIVDQTGRGLVRDMGDITTADTTTDTYIGISTQVANATTQATNSANSATASAASASAAATSATNAANSETAAANSATAAAASYDSFDDRYLGAKASAPSVDNDGNALITGALYFDTTTPGMYVWTGSAWTVMATSGDIESVTAGTGLSGGGTAGAVTVSLDTSSVYVVPSQTTHTGKFLTTDGSSASWVSLSDWGTI